MQKRSAKRKRARIPDLADADPFLVALQERISTEVAVLKTLEEAIDDGDTDDERPVQPREAVHAAAPASPAQADALDSSQMPHARTELSHLADAADAEAAGLRARAKRERDKSRRARRKDAASFSLAAVNEEMAAFVAGDGEALELPGFSRMQRSQVRALAALYGLEARACGRAGQTLFRTDRSGPLTVDGRAQAERLLACSVSHGRPTPALQQQMDAAMRQGRASLARTIPGSNKGARMLAGIDWRAGAGLGAHAQGRTEPIPLHLGQRRQGLGS